MMFISNVTHSLTLGQPTLVTLVLYRYVINTGNIFYIILYICILYLYYIFTLYCNWKYIFLGSNSESLCTADSKCLHRILQTPPLQLQINLSIFKLNYNLNLIMYYQYYLLCTASCTQQLSLQINLYCFCLLYTSDAADE